MSNSIIQDHGRAVRDPEFPIERDPRARTSASVLRALHERFGGSWLTVGGGRIFGHGLLVLVNRDEPNAVEVRVAGDVVACDSDPVVAVERALRVLERRVNEASPILRAFGIEVRDAQ